MWRMSRRARMRRPDELRLLLALPRDLPERTWAEIIQREDNDLLILDLREEIFDEAMKICYERYMEKQSVKLTAHCAALAWLKLIDWQFFRQDPGEEGAGAWIPRRAESWAAEEGPAPAPPDPWARRALPAPPPPAPTTPATRLDYPPIDDIPQYCWFPGKVQLGSESELVTFSEKTNSDVSARSEVEQRVTDYTAEQSNAAVAAAGRAAARADGRAEVRSPVPSPVAPPGSPPAVEARPRLRVGLNLSSVRTKSRGALLPAASESAASVVSDCRLRSLRLETQYEVSPELVDAAAAQPTKRK